MNERYIKWYAPYLSREFEMLAFGNGGGLPLILFPTSFGSYYQNKDFGLVGSVSGYVDAGKVTVYCPDAIDLESFYNKSIHPADRMRTHNAYENVIVGNVFDLARHECNCHHVAVCGASLGAYHAGNIAFRHPDAVSHLISLSGSFDISSFFDGYHDDNIYFNSPYEISAERNRPVEIQSHGRHHWHRRMG
jgi:esterase/lipase superfamily enzyme